MAWQNQFSVTNSTTDVTIVTAPAANTSRMIPAGGIVVANKDTATITATIKILNTATDVILYPSIEILPGATWSNQKTVHCLDATTQSLEIVLAAAPAATQADVTVTYRDEAQ
jgi:hypothetical protein